MAGSKTVMSASAPTSIRLTFPRCWYQFLSYSHRSFRLNRLGCWRPIAECTVRPERVVLMSPALDQDLGLKQRIEDLAIEKLSAEFPIERFDIAILPWASGLDEQGAHADPTQRVSDRRRCKFRSLGSFLPRHSQRSRSDRRGRALCRDQGGRGPEGLQDHPLPSRLTTGFLAPRGGSSSDQAAQGSTAELAAQSVTDWSGNAFKNNLLPATDGSSAGALLAILRHIRSMEGAVQESS